MTATSGSAGPDRIEKLLARLDAGARHQDYPEAFGESWPQLCHDAASAISRLAAMTATHSPELTPEQRKEILTELRTMLGYMDSRDSSASAIGVHVKEYHKLYRLMEAHFIALSTTGAPKP